MDSAGGAFTCKGSAVNPSNWPGGWGGWLLGGVWTSAPLVHSSMDRWRDRCFSCGHWCHVRPRRPDILPTSYDGGPLGRHWSHPIGLCYVYIRGRGWGWVYVHVETLRHHQNRLFSAYVVLFSRPYRADSNKRAVGIDATGERVKNLVNSKKFIPQWRV